MSPEPIPVPHPEPFADDAQLRQIDAELLRLIETRCRRIGELAGGRDHAAGWFADHSAAAASVDGGADASLRRDVRAALLHQIITACHHAIRPARVAFLGPVDSYSHLAAAAYFGESATPSPVASIGAVFDAVRRGDCDTGLVPIENSTDGRVVDTLSRLSGDDVSIIGEVLLPIHHNLLATVDRDAITEVHSKPQALSQCRTWLADHLPGVRTVESTSTADAARLAAARPGVAAVASLAAASRYGLAVVAADIEDQRDNVTRFAVLGRQTPPPTGDDKTTLLFRVDHQPGALADVMTLFKTHRVNLTWIESFPQPGKPNEYFFVVEFRGHRDDPATGSAIAAVTDATCHTRVLGSYARGRVV